MTTISASAGSIRGLLSFLSVFVEMIFLEMVFFPIPRLTSSDVDGTLFIAPLAYLAATLVTALYFSQLWLFTLSAFGVVWLDTQMAWRAQEVLIPSCSTLPSGQRS